MKRLLLVVAAILSTSGMPALGQSESEKVQRVLERDFQARGQAGMDRVRQDGLQRLCTESRDQPPAELARQMEADQMKTVVYPTGSLIGDWQRGERIAQGGRGMTWSDRPGAPADGSCYNCHQLAPQEASYGTLGPSLYKFGAQRGNTAEMQRYVYAKIFNAKAFNACSQMPRLGASGTLTPEQIRDLVGLLLDPASPVNK